MDNASVNAIVHVSWGKRMTLLRLLPEWSLFYGHGHETHLDEGKKDNRASAEPYWCCPSDLPQFQPELQNQRPLPLLHPWPCCVPVLSHHVLFAGHPHWLWLYVCLQAESLFSFTGWLGLGLAPLLIFVDPWTLPIHLRPMGLSCKERLPKVLSLLPGNSLILEDGLS